MYMLDEMPVKYTVLLESYTPYNKMQTAYLIGWLKVALIDKV